LSAKAGGIGEVIVASRGIYDHELKGLASRWNGNSMNAMKSISYWEVF
jgi:hypothetical protein